MSHEVQLYRPKYGSSRMTLAKSGMHGSHDCTSHEPSICTIEKLPARRLSSVKILVVEDDPSSADILCLFFKMEGYDAECAYCGEDALRTIAEDPPEIIFLDLGLPDMSGYEVAARIHNLAGGAKIHLVALTGRDETEDRKRIAQAGFDQHLVKPPLPAMLREAVRKAMMV